MIDTHCHLTDPRLGEQLDDVLERAEAAGVTRMITVGTELEDDRAAISLCRTRLNLRCAVGIHPNYTQHVQVADVEQLCALQDEPSVVALGEMGLDYHHQFADRKHQASIFQAQLHLAQEVGKPVVIHCREAVEDCLAIMAAFPNVPADFHCFTGTADEARRILDRGYFIGYTGVVTFKNTASVREAVKLTPMDRLLVETDAPYLSPEPYRKQKVNEPALVVYTAAEVARLKGVTVEEIDRVTTENALRFFRWNG